MLLCADIHVFTDHKNLTLDTLKMQRMLHLPAKIEDFHPYYTTLRGPTTF
jgi:hypothetical protein